MAGGSSGGGGMLRSIGRVARTVTGGGVHDPVVATPTSFSKSVSHRQSSITNLVSISPSSIPSISVKSPTRISPPHFFDDSEWNIVDRNRDEEHEEQDTEIRAFDDRIFSIAPSEDEVHAAVSDIKQIITSSGLEFSSPYDINNDIVPIGSVRRVSSVGSDPDWVEPFLQISSEVDMHMDGPTIVYDAFHLLQTESAFQRLVSSLSMDKAVWEAVLRNEAVQELRNTSSSGTVEEGGGKKRAREFIREIAEATRRGVVGIVERIYRIVIGSTVETSVGNETTVFERTLRSSVVMSILVLLVVVLSRARSA